MPGPAFTLRRTIGRSGDGRPETRETKERSVTNRNTNVVLQLLDWIVDDPEKVNPTECGNGFIGLRLALLRLKHCASYVLFAPWRYLNVSHFHSS